MSGWEVFHSKRDLILDVLFIDEPKNSELLPSELMFDHKGNDYLILRIKKRK